MNKDEVNIIVDIEVKEEHLKDFLAETIILCNNVNRFEKGCITYKLARDVNDKTKFKLLEAYRDLDALEFHKGMSYFKHWKVTVEPYMAKPRSASFIKDVLF